MCRLGVKREGAFYGSVDSVLRAVVFKACGSTDPMRVGRSAGRIFGQTSDRPDEPTKLSLGMVASLQIPLLFHLAKSLYLAS
jgi:hypothetical protein